MNEYKNQKELYEALIPAFNVKLRMFKNNEFNFLTKKDIWDYLKDNVWVNSVNLTISQMVSNIINVEGSKIVNYLKSKRLEVGDRNG